jgi:hypothetical protein
MRKFSNRVIIVIVLLIYALPHTVFADTWSTIAVTTWAWWEASVAIEIVNILMKFVTWGWTIVAVLAWKLMTNDFIYATWLWLDKTLYSMWLYMKNIANFALVFFLVSKIASSVFTKNSFDLKKDLPNFLLASILVNMSWFLMGAVIDVANVATAAVWSFPQVIVSEDPTQSAQTAFLNASIPNKICANIEKWQTECSGIYDTSQKIDRIRARFNDMSGPLLFLWASIFRFQDYNELNTSIRDIKDFTIWLFIKLLVMLMFMAPIIALFVINIQRIFYLRLWIIFSPLIVVFTVLGKKPWGKLDSLFDIKEIIGMTFQPVFVVWWMSIVLLLSMSMYYILGWKPGNQPANEPITKVIGVSEIVTSTNSSTFTNNTAGTSITIVWDIFNNVANYAWGLFWYLITTWFVIMLLRAVVKISTSSSKLASWTYKKVMDLWQNLVTGINFIPIGWKNVSLASVLNSGNGWVMNTIDSKIRQWVINPRNSTAADNLDNGLFWGKLWQFMQKTYGDSFKPNSESIRDLSRKESDSYFADLKTASNLNTFGDRLYANMQKSAEKTKNKRITLQSEQFKQTVYNSIMNWPPSLRNEIKTLLWVSEDKDITIDKLFWWQDDWSKKFLEFLQTRLAGKTIQTNALRWTSINYSPSMTIFGWKKNAPAKDE